MTVALETTEEKTEFLEQSAEFLERIAVNVNGLSPGGEVLAKVASGFHELSRKEPRHRDMFVEAAGVYEVIVRRSPGGTHPPGGAMFADLAKISELAAKLRDLAWEMEDSA